jgi:hypothetical protein
MPTLTFAEFSELFESFERTALRLEARPRTDVPSERADVEAFLTGRLPPRRQREPDDPWSAMTERKAAAGSPLMRVRVMEEPLTDYNRFMVYCARASVHHGEAISFLARDVAAALDLPDHDFWVFDSARLVELRFTGDDRPLDHDLITDPDLVARHGAWFERAFAAAVPWADYLAEDPSREEPPARMASRRR